MILTLGCSTFSVINVLYQYFKISVQFRLHHTLALGGLGCMIHMLKIFTVILHTTYTFIIIYFYFTDNND
jgi:hypothetical protein